MGIVEELLEEQRETNRRLADLARYVIDGALRKRKAHKAKSSPFSYDEIKEMFRR